MSCNNTYNSNVIDMVSYIQIANANVMSTLSLYSNLYRGIEAETHQIFHSAFIPPKEV